MEKKIPSTGLPQRSNEKRNKKSAFFTFCNVPHRLLHKNGHEHGKLVDITLQTKLAFNQNTKKIQNTPRHHHISGAEKQQKWQWSHADSVNFARSYGDRRFPSFCVARRCTLAAFRSGWHARRPGPDLSFSSPRSAAWGRHCGTCRPGRFSAEYFRSGCFARRSLGRSWSTSMLSRLMLSADCSRGRCNCSLCAVVGWPGA